MVNSWSLLYDELMSKNILSIGMIMIAMILIVKILLKKRMMDVMKMVGILPIIPVKTFWHEDGFSLTGNPAPAAQDTITLDFGTSDQGMVNFGASTTSSYGRYFWWCWN